MVKIKRVSNGFIVQYSDDPVSGNAFETIEVCEQRDSGCKCEALKQTLQIIIEALGEMGSKHDYCRIEIKCKCKTLKT